MLAGQTVLDKILSPSKEPTWMCTPGLAWVPPPPLGVFLLEIALSSPPGCCPLEKRGRILPQTRRVCFPHPPSAIQEKSTPPPCPLFIPIMDDPCGFWQPWKNITCSFFMWDIPFLFLLPLCADGFCGTPQNGAGDRRLPNAKIPPSSSTGTLMGFQKGFDLNLGGESPTKTTTKKVP